MLRRLTALFALAAFAAPLLGAGNEVSASAGGHHRMATNLSGQVADLGGAGSAHCGACDDATPESPTPCDQDAAQCASMTACAFSSAIIPQSTSGALESTLTLAVFDVDARPIGERASPEPPPPRA